VWKFVLANSQGTSHVRGGQPCQDFADAVPLTVDGAEYLIAVCADGAGSASFAEIGSRLACVAAMERARQLVSQTPFEELQTQSLPPIFESAHAALAMEARAWGVRSRELACTLLVSILGKNRGLFAQIGDGAIVASSEGGLEPVFWPQSGEYVNTTLFLSDENFAEQVQYRSIEAPINELGMFTDGIERLALRFADRSVHAPFFAPMFAALRDTADPLLLHEPLRLFLDSPQVNERTDDDKTLLLAVRGNHAPTRPAVP
jgi:hypothetical protein